MNIGKPSEIKTAVREVKALVAERKIRDRLAAKDLREADPVMKRRIDDFVAAEATRRVGQRHVTNFSSPAFDQRHCQHVGSRSWKFAAHPTVGRHRELFLQKLARTLDLESSHACPCEDISGWPDRNGGLSEPIPTCWVVVTHVAHQPAPASR